MAVQVPVKSKAQLATTLPTVLSDDVKPTVPVGVVALASLSVTVTVQVIVCPITIASGRQDILVDVARLFTVTVMLPLLAA